MCTCHGAFCPAAKAGLRSSYREMCVISIYEAFCHVVCGRQDVVRHCTEALRFRGTRSSSPLPSLPRPNAPYDCVAGNPPPEGGATRHGASLGRQRSLDQASERGGKEEAALTSTGSGFFNERPGGVRGAQHRHQGLLLGLEGSILAFCQASHAFDGVIGAAGAASPALPAAVQRGGALQR